MTRQLIKGMTMLLLVVALALFSAVASAYAQSTSTASADIPFEFVVGNKTLAAGRYQLSAASAGSEVMKIRGNEQSAMTLTTGLEHGARSEQGKLVFNRYGNRYFLREIWNAGDNTGRRLPKSKEEKAIQRELASVRSKTESNFERIQVALVRQ